MNVKTNKSKIACLPAGDLKIRRFFEKKLGKKLQKGKRKNESLSLYSLKTPLCSIKILDVSVGADVLDGPF